MRIHELWGKWSGQDVWIIGTGPSMRFYPPEVFKNRCTIGLNQAWRYFTNNVKRTSPSCLDFSLTAHPELVLEYEKTDIRPRTKWIVKRKPPLDHLTFNDLQYYVFDTSTEFDSVTKRIPDTLFLGRGIHCTAIALAAQMGAKNIFLVGVDMNELGGDHHGHEQHVRFLGLPAKDVYTEYYRWASKIRRLVRDAYGANVATLSPFLGLGHEEADYSTLKAELRLPDLPAPKDVSPYTREKADI